MQNSWNFNKYTIRYVYGELTSELQEKIINFWLINKAIPDAKTAEQRAPQVVLVALDESNTVVGVNTVYINKLHPAGPPWLFYRQFIQPKDRVFGMMEFMTTKTWELLNEKEIEGNPKGVVIITENPKLMRRGMVALFRKKGWHKIGKTDSNQDVRCKEFT